MGKAENRHSVPLRVKAGDARPPADRESLDFHAHRAGGEEMPELMDYHYDPQADEAEDYRHDQHSISLTASAAFSRAFPSISNILSGR